MKDVMIEVLTACIVVGSTLIISQPKGETTRAKCVRNPSMPRPNYLHLTRVLSQAKESVPLSESL